MSRRPATNFRSLLTASLSAIALAGCVGDRSETPAPQSTVASTPAASTPAAEPPPTPPPAAAPVGTPQVEPAPTPVSSAPEPTPASAPTPAPSSKPSAQQQPDALQWMRDSEARRADYQRRLAEAETSLENANLSMVTWERNVLAFKNPFLARPQLAPEDDQAIAGMNGAERVRWSEGRLSSVSAARDTAQKTIDELKKNPPQN